jgi:hypothetical protein
VRAILPDPPVDGYVALKGGMVDVDVAPVALVREIVGLHVVAVFGKKTSEFVICTC